MRSLAIACALLLASSLFLTAAPRRQALPSRRPLASGPAYHVHPGGEDGGDGSKDRPWRTVGHALGRLRPGDTLYLHGGVYRENLTVALRGRPDAPITVRGYPGEDAIVDGSLAEFFEAPAQAWEPCPGGVPGEYRSRRAYPNLRDVMGLLGDSLIGLHTYHHRKDLQASGEQVDWENWDDTRGSDLKPLYCGPGIWYDHQTGHIHARLAATKLPILGENNYRGETDPRRLPLVIAPYRSTPLTIDGARHVRLQDFAVRGAGYDAVVLQQASHVELDGLAIWAGSYGLRAMGAQHLKVHRCGFFGSVPPWCFRGDTSLRSYPGRPHRDITRFGTHALLVPEAGREFSVHAYPINDDWEISYCDFHDAHDGLYLGGVNVRFHHNLVRDLQDDGIYLSPMAPRFGDRRAEIHLSQSWIGACLTALAFGGPEKATKDLVHIYRNVIDLREPVLTGRPSTRSPQGGTSFGKVMGDHGSPPWSEMRTYHNTLVMKERGRSSDMGLLGALSPERPRQLFNNLFLHLGGLPGLVVPGPDTGRADGNLYWQPDLPADRAEAFFRRYRSSPLFTSSKTVLPGGFTAHSLVADPLVGPSDLRPSPKSPAVDAGVALPEGWADPLREVDRGKPDIGALPLGAPALAVGRSAAPR